MHIIAIANHKGGTGKTTTTHTLGHILGEEGYSVLMIDFDPQGSLTLCCGIDLADVAKDNISQCLLPKRDKPWPIPQIMQQVKENLWIAPAHSSLERMQSNLLSRLTGRDTALKRAVDQLEHVDFVLIDCSPSINILTVNALVAAQHVLVPTKPQALDLGGFGVFLDTLDEIDEINPTLNRLGVLFTFFDPRLLMHRAAHRGMMASDSIAGFKLFEATIGGSVKVAEAPGVGESIITYKPGNKRALEYRALATEILGRLDHG